GAEVPRRPGAGPTRRSRRAGLGRRRPGRLVNDTPAPDGAPVPDDTGARRAPSDVATPEDGLVAFVGDLRRAGLTVPIGCTVRLVEAVARLGAEGARSVYWAGRATLVPRPEDIATYDRVFAARWRGLAPTTTVVRAETLTVLV